MVQDVLPDITCMYGVSACQKGTSRRRTYRRDVVVVEDYARVRQLVDIWSRDLHGTVKADVIPALNNNNNNNNNNNTESI